MAQSLAKNYMHIIFSTKNRENLIFPPIENELHSYLAGICTELECYPVKIGGYTDHVHILCILSKKIALMKLLQEVKSASSKWMKTKGPSLADFTWQNGYGAFSVSPGHIDILSQYIETQHQHHKAVTFQDEYRNILRKYNIGYDEAHVWD